MVAWAVALNRIVNRVVEEVNSPLRANKARHELNRSIYDALRAEGRDPVPPGEVRVVHAGNGRADVAGAGSVGDPDRLATDRRDVDQTRATRPRRLADDGHER